MSLPASPERNLVCLGMTTSSNVTWWLGGKLLLFGRISTW